jgi:hypothetical protein
MTSFLRKFIMGQTGRDGEREREREREKERRDPLFLILLSRLMLSTLEVQEHFSLTIQSISRSFVHSLARSLSPSLVHAGILFCFMLSSSLGQSAMRKEKE